MLNEKDRLLMERLKEECPDVSYLISRLEEEQRSLLSYISHEVRNPLTLINSSIQLIEKSHPEVIGFKFWDSVKEDIQFLRHFLEDLSVFSSAAVIHPAPINLNELVRGTAESFLPAFHERRMTLSFSPCPGLPPVPADQIKLREVLINLLKNAMEAMDAGGSAVLKLHKDPSSVRLTVADSGIGIPDADAEAVFLPFRTFKPQGTGLGLPLSKAILLAHGGNLTFTSSEGAGTVFTLTLPIPQ